MLKKLSSIVLLLLATSAVFAQNGNRCFGFYFGPNFPNVNITSPDLSVQNRTGSQLGAFYRKGGFIYGQAGLEYLRLESTMTANDSVSGTVQLNRLQLPLYGGFNLLNPTKKVFNVRAFAGPVITYTLNAPSENPDLSLTDFSRFGVNGTIGAGVDMLIFSFDAGYTFGLNNLFSKDFNGKADYAFLNIGLKF